MSPTQDRDLHLPPNNGDLREPGLNELIANESIPLKGSAGPNPAISEKSHWSNESGPGLRNQ